ncbi:MAG: penicillin-binding protein [Lentimicrobiaceae bacterium]|jgi:penicillin-binding protein 1A|nr:penicillin-binding protein [Lentimicrobiaceae bacterium]MCP4909926.1 penicillin-binding protein [Bacteroidota bacterium]MBT3454935.1 penicillin-binding protein [Lentimicrobiaceae bacterium]MBT3818439.1 penicillin-binding protein [Lentimicrobiaceae bacterium]MBT4060807.1 penicillin-binding protein [Lentimicrobiaceae bacterium]
MKSNEPSVPQKKIFNYIFKLWFLWAALLMLVFLLFYGIASEWYGPMPTFEELENPKSNLASEVYSSDGDLLGTYFIENRSNISYRGISPNLINAVLSIEDIRFEEHSGIDEKALLRVFYGVATGNSRGGGSTLTQQLAKNLFPRGERLSKPQLVLRKFKEWITALKLERYYSKEEIIAMYLNTVTYGHNTYGIKSATSAFFDCTPDSLNLQQSALMAGVVNAPTRYSPISNPQRSISRRNLVLKQMQKYGYITSEVYDSVSQLPLGVSKYTLRDHNQGLATYLREYLRGELKEWCKNHYKPDGTPYNLYKDGLKIYTTIDSRMQRYAEEAVREHLQLDLQPAFYKHWEGYTNAPFDFEEEKIEESVERIIEQSIRRSERYRKLKNLDVSEDSIRASFMIPVEMRVFSWEGSIDTIMSPIDSIIYYKHILQAGLLSMESKTGYVRAMVGGIDYQYFKFDHVVQGKRQVGSTFKPFLYTLAMQEGEYSPCYKVSNIQYSVELYDGTFWSPRNSGNDRVGEEVTLKWALANSNNWISAYLIGRFSPQSVRQMARKMGVQSDIPAVPSIALGTPDLSLYEMVGAMNTFANKGVYVVPTFITKIEDKNGNLLERFVPDKTEAMNEVTAYKMLKLMEGVVESGTGIRLRYRYGFHNPIAGKTGTTQNQSDGWFMGITPDLTTGVWVGAEDRSVHFRTIGLGQGANMALPIWAIYMKKVYSDPSLGVSQGEFDKPLRDVMIEFDCEKYDRERQNSSLDQNQEDEF